MRTKLIDDQQRRTGTWLIATTPTSLAISCELQPRPHLLATLLSRVLSRSSPNLHVCELVLGDAKHQPCPWGGQTASPTSPLGVQDLPPHVLAASERTMRRLSVILMYTTIADLYSNTMHVLTPWGPQPFHEGACSAESAALACLDILCISYRGPCPMFVLNELQHLSNWYHLASLSFYGTNKQACSKQVMCCTKTRGPACHIAVNPCNRSGSHHHGSIS